MSTKPEGFEAGKQLVARVQYDGGVTHDCDLTYLSPDNGLSIEELREAFFSKEVDSYLYFARWEWPGEWSML